MCTSSRRTLNRWRARAPTIFPSQSAFRRSRTMLSSSRTLSNPIPKSARGRRTASRLSMMVWSVRCVRLPTDARTLVSLAAVVRRLSFQGLKFLALLPCQPTSSQTPHGHPLTGSRVLEQAQSSSGAVSRSLTSLCSICAPLGSRARLERSIGSTTDSKDTGRHHHLLEKISRTIKWVAILLFPTGR